MSLQLQLNNLCNLFKNEIILENGHCGYFSIALNHYLTYHTKLQTQILHLIREATQDDIEYTYSIPVFSHSVVYIKEFESKQNDGSYDYLGSNAITKWINDRPEYEFEVTSSLIDLIPRPDVVHTLYKRLLSFLQ